ncbi:acetyltransferase [Escherichia coli]|uniref:acetyltransferase n=1 Tax=Escherichia coli TaxID=562 RepID=UPI000BE1E5D1|nr:acetyltransferase [Escherichia coli]EFI4460024.1 acetyltransferase [Escherichia coli]EIV6970797.1 acetyltransferase [Escherichia coli]EIV6980678.1 acetyltransferase [Escherichia coli]EJA9188308.1 acetyltransferase [Escherichia coli]EJF1582800.1 acetyltransferase [Escherichia coli]
MNSKPVVLIGGGGHASVLLDILNSNMREVIAIVSPHDVPARTIFSGIKVFRTDDDIFQYSNKDIELVNGIGMVPRSSVRKNVTESYLRHGYQFASVIAKDALISAHAHIMNGAQVLSGTIVNPGVVIGSHSIINTRAIIEHDCQIGNHSFIGPGAVLCGQVKTGESVFVGAGSTIIPGMILGSNSMVGAGAVLVQSLDNGQVCYPARSVIK